MKIKWFKGLLIGCVFVMPAQYAMSGGSASQMALRLLGVTDAVNSAYAAGFQTAVAAMNAGYTITDFDPVTLTTDLVFGFSNGVDFSGISANFTLSGAPVSFNCVTQRSVSDITGDGSAFGSTTNITYTSPSAVTCGPASATFLDSAISITSGDSGSAAATGTVYTNETR